MRDQLVEQTIGIQKIYITSQENGPSTTLLNRNSKCYYLIKLFSTLTLFKPDHSPSSHYLYQTNVDEHSPDPEKMSPKQKQLHHEEAKARKHAEHIESVIGAEWQHFLDSRVDGMQGTEMG